MDEFPRKIAGSFFKVKAHKEKRGKRPKGPTAKRRAAKRRGLDVSELAAMLEARERDRFCRFPLCGCLTKNLFIQHAQAEVSHSKHRGMGGDATGERSALALLLLVCNWRHKLSKFSIDQKTLRWEPLTADGANGPIRWLLDVSRLDGMELLNAMGYVLRPNVGTWWELARETAPHQYEPFTDAQAAVLAYLADMKT